MPYSPSWALFADAKFHDFQYSAFYLYMKSYMSGAYTVYMYLTIGACARVTIVTRGQRQRQPANITR